MDEEEGREDGGGRGGGRVGGGGRERKLKGAQLWGRNKIEVEVGSLRECKVRRVSLDEEGGKEGIIGEELKGCWEGEGERKREGRASSAL